MTATKTIFEKSYMIKAQAIKAAEKEFGANWAERYEIAARADILPARWAVKALPAPVIEEEDGHSGTPTGWSEIEAGDEDAQVQADRLANALMGDDPLKPRFSSIKSPVKRVWHIADAMPKASRKEVVAECVRQGVAYGTARTQYQAWFKASQECERGDIRKPYEKAQKDGE